MQIKGRRLRAQAVSDGSESNLNAPDLPDGSSVAGSSTRARSNGPRSIDSPSTDGEQSTLPRPPDLQSPRSHGMSQTSTDDAESSRDSVGLESIETTNEDDDYELSVSEGEGSEASVVADMVGPRGRKVQKNSTRAKGKPAASSRAGAVKNQVQGRKPRGNIASKQSNRNPESAPGSRLPAAKQSNQATSPQLDQTARASTSGVTNQANPKANASKARLPKPIFFAGHDGVNSDTGSQTQPLQSKKTQDALSNEPKKRAAPNTIRSNAKKQKLDVAPNTSNGGMQDKVSSTVQREQKPKETSSEEVYAITRIQPHHDGEEENSQENSSTSVPEDMLADLRRKTDKVKSLNQKQVTKQPLVEDQEDVFENSIKKNTKPIAHGTRSQDRAAVNVASALISPPQVVVSNNLSGSSQLRANPRSQKMENVYTEAEVIPLKQSPPKPHNNDHDTAEEIATEFRAEPSYTSDGVDIRDDSIPNPGPKHHIGSFASPPQVSGQTETKTFTLVSDDASLQRLPIVGNSRQWRTETTQEFKHAPGAHPSFDRVPQHSSSKAFISERHLDPPQPRALRSTGAVLGRSAQTEIATASDRNIKSASYNPSQRVDHGLGRQEEETPSQHLSRFQTDDIHHPRNLTSDSKQSRYERNVSPLHPVGAIRGFQSHSDMDLSLNPKSVEFARKMSQRPYASDSDHLEYRHTEFYQDKTADDEKSNFSRQANRGQLAGPDDSQEGCTEIKGAREDVYHAMEEAIADAFKHLGSKEADLDAIPRSFQRNIPRIFGQILTRQRGELNTCVSQFNADCMKKQAMYKGAMEYVGRLQYTADQDKDPDAAWKKMAAEEELALKKYNQEITRL
ncbi:hypothetical protein F5Y18DRAFT_137263 [Xylariaceae sp. FL1019]|nr:hypothetical protein F5Y18DRAFT_137263 [Xylariaceae sp. FL1019]